MTEAPVPAPVQEPAPVEMRDRELRAEFRRASVWFGIAIAIVLVVILAQPLMLILGGLVFAALLDGGARLLGRVLPLRRGALVGIVMLLATIFLLGLFLLLGLRIYAQAALLWTTLQAQSAAISDWLVRMGLMPAHADLARYAQRELGSFGKITGYVGTLFDAVASLLLIIAIGLFVALEPRIYERGFAWLVPSRLREDFRRTLERMARTLRHLLAGRLIGMASEGGLTWVLLSIGHVPMSLLLGFLTGVFAFIPNIGAVISGVLMIAVGFSAGTTQGIWAIVTYLIVHVLDGYVVVPTVARRTVDLPPALTLGAQILLSALLGILGLTLADPITAMIKVALERQSEKEAEKTSAMLIAVDPKVGAAET